MDERAFKKYKIYTLLLLIVAVVAIVVSIAAVSLRNEVIAAQGNVDKPEDFSQIDDLDYYTPKSGVSQENSALESDVLTQYRITIHEGRIGVFRAGESEPFMISDVRVYLLPEEDVEILLRGIRVDSFSEVKAVLEDYE